jgi:hypothetical protein
MEGGMKVLVSKLRAMHLGPCFLLAVFPTSLSENLSSDFSATTSAPRYFFLDRCRDTAFSLSPKPPIEWA